MFQISLNELSAFLIKPAKSKRMNFQMDDSVSIVKTTQSKKDGININFHISEFVEYHFLKIYVIGNRLYFYPLNDTDFGYDKVECFTLSQNPTCRCMNTKVGSLFGVEKLSKFEGKYKIKRDKETNSQNILFYIEK